jgi:hypothetical protein
VIKHEAGRYGRREQIKVVDSLPTQSNFNDLHVELAEIDENLMRSDLSAAHNRPSLCLAERRFMRRFTGKRS